MRLAIRNVVKTFPGVRAVDNVSLRLEEGKTLGIVGESGSGKSVTCLTVMGLNDAKKTTSTGSVLLDGEEILGAGQRKLQEIRGQRWLRGRRCRSASPECLG